MDKPKQMKRAQSMIKGLIISWSDPDPLIDSPVITDGKVTHKSPVLRLSAQKVWRDFGAWIMTQPDLLWRVDFTVIYRPLSDLQKADPCRVIHRAALHDIAHACDPAIREAMAACRGVVRVDFVVECLGRRSATEADYGDYAP